MSIKQDYINLQSNFDKIFSETSEKHEKNINEFNIILEEFELIKIIYKEHDAFRVMNEVQMDLLVANYLASIGIYRTAYATLRSALELGMLFIYFIDNNYDYICWKDNKKDISWSRLFGENSFINTDYFSVFYGVLEKLKFEKIIADIKESYRKCSEYTHGKYGYMMTIQGATQFSYDKDKYDDFYKEFSVVSDLIYIVQGIRFKKNIERFYNEDNEFNTELIEEYNEKMKKYELEGI